MRIPCDDLVVGERELGRGSFARVLDSRWRGMPVAVKEFYSVLDSKYNEEEWAKEMRINTILRHPNIVQFYGACLDERCYPLIIMEVLTTTLRNVVAHSGHMLSWRERLDILTDIARGLDYIHKQKIAHLDLSDANVLVSDQLVAKVSDLGQARMLGRTRTFLSPTNTDYCAPERVENGETRVADAYKADVFSAGMIVIQVVLGDPIHRPRREEDLMKITDDASRNLARRCVDENPESRPHMAELLEGLLDMTKNEVYKMCATRRKVLVGGDGKVAVVP